MGASYKLIKKGNKVGIMCLRCDRISWCPDDVEYKYCGNCHKFHEEEAEAE